MADQDSVGVVEVYSSKEEERISEIIDAFKDASILEKSHSESESVSFTSALEESDMELVEELDPVSSRKLLDRKMNSLPQPLETVGSLEIAKSPSIAISGNSTRPNQGNNGGVEIYSGLNPFSTTLSCLLFEPSDDDIIEDEIRYIYLNQILSDDEQLYLAKLRKYAKNHGQKFPHSVWVQALRFLASSRFHVQTAMEMMLSNHEFRIKELPISEKDVIEDLKIGAIYWHGRDIKFRPILVVKLARLDIFVGEIERIQKLLCFCLEFFLKYLQVAGRVENWNVIIDLAGKGITDLPIQVLKSVLSLVNTRYRMRLYRMFIVNCPKFINVVSNALVAAIPGSSVRKVRFIDESYSDEIINLVPLEQLEESYGGKCPNLTENFYPFRFYPMNELDKAFPNIHAIIPPEYISGMSIEIPPRFDLTKLPWLNQIPNINFTKKTADRLSQILGTEIKPKTSKEDIINP
ncbi:Sec14 domain containing [Cryptosporidium sp. chipmunk genotype I]|uniref:Sec14 domain containing n=1 Tax=Cryptosporidium sp. chipmunk genotype I TaxID=1280935 RepID=UPI00351A30A6|nr:Sec14 domain containing [Cryptosporidium sp. chipmunk genotype I]